MVREQWERVVEVVFVLEEEWKSGGWDHIGPDHLLLPVLLLA
jgi:hypothetical protein